MPRKRKLHPADPAAVARRRAAERAADRDPSAWGANQEALPLPANADVSLATAQPRRLDLFDRLLARRALTTQGVAAVRRLQADLALRHAAPGGVSCYGLKIDGGVAGDPFAERRLRAGSRIAEVLALSGPASAALIRALVERQALGGVEADWRAVVAASSGERLADAQGAILQAALDNLVGAYALLDRRGGLS